MLIAPIVSKLLRFFPPVVTGTIIAIIGISLMRVGVGWAMGGPAFLAQSHRRAQAGGDGRQRQGRRRGRQRRRCKLAGPIPMVDNPNYGALDNMAIAGLRAGRSSCCWSSTPRASSPTSRCCWASSPAASWRSAMGKMNFDKVGKAALVRRRHALRLRHADLRHRDDPDHDAGDDRRDDRVDRHVPRAVGHHRQEDRPARAGRRPAHRRPGHADRRHLQHLPVHQLLAERRPGRRHRRARAAGSAWPAASS